MVTLLAGDGGGGGGQTWETKDRKRNKELLKDTEREKLNDDV